MRDIPRHISHSQVDEYTTCPLQYKLHRLDQLPGTMWLAGPAGTAFHAWSEAYDKQTAPRRRPLKWVHFLDLAVSEEETATGTPWTEWAVSKDRDMEWWSDNGLELCAKYISWRAQTNWEVVDIEKKLDVVLPGMTCAFVAYVDRVFKDPETDELWVVDIKTGTIKQKSGQLEEYVAALNYLGYGVTHAAYYNAHTGKLRPEVDLSGVDTGWLVNRLQPVREGIEAGDWTPKRGYYCSFCAYKPLCPEWKVES